MPLGDGSGFGDTSTGSEAKVLGIYDLRKTNTRSAPEILRNPWFGEDKH